MRGWLLFPALMVFSICGFAQGLTPEMRADIDRRISFQRKWGLANSPGAELRAVETHRQSLGKGVSFHAYQLQAKGLPFDVEYELLMLDTMASRPEDLQSVGDVWLDNRDGKVLDSNNSVHQLLIPDPAPGEPYRLAVSAKKGNYHAFITILPNPIEGSDHDCKVSVIRLMRNFELAFVQVTGFPRETEIAFRGNSEGEVHESKIKTNADGYGDLGILPAKLGKSKGKMEIQFTAPGCAPKVSFKWGKTEDGQVYQ